MADIELPSCFACEDGTHDVCNNIATWPDTGGLTNCWCPCWQESSDDG